MNTDVSLVCFKAISNFTTELGSIFSKTQRSLKLYCRLINKTTIVHDKSIKKHIDAFRTFCIANRNAIVNKDVSGLVVGKISYSQRVYIDIADIFSKSDAETTGVIWDHLLCISALVDPAGKAKEVLKKNFREGKTGGDETNFLTDIIEKVEKHVDPNANPMEAVSSIMQSGIFTELIGGMNNGLSNGSLDIGKLMGAVQGMVGQLGDQKSGDPQADGALNMLTSMIGNMGNMGNMGTADDGEMKAPDMNRMMQQMMSSVQGMASGVQVEEAEAVEEITKETNE